MRDLVENVHGVVIRKKDQADFVFFCMLLFTYEIFDLKDKVFLKFKK